MLRSLVTFSLVVLAVLAMSPAPALAVDQPAFWNTPEITFFDSSVCEQISFTFGFGTQEGFQSNTGIFSVEVYDMGMMVYSGEVTFTNGVGHLIMQTTATTHTFSIIIMNPYTFVRSNESPPASQCSIRSCGGFVVGDPQFVGLRGQNYQVHGVSGEIYNIISDIDLQYNSRFVFLDQGECPVVNGKKQKACWSHPGSYLGELGLKTRAGDRIHLATGDAKTGYTAVEVNGKALQVGDSVILADNMGSVSFNTTHLASVTIGNWDFAFENSDMFVNQRVRVLDARSLRSHGLLGQTWKEVTYPNAIKHIQGQVDDYVIRDNDIFGDNFVFNTFN